MKLNKAHSEEFLKRLDEKPKDRTAFVFQAIIVSLIIHIFILFVTQMLTQDNRMAKEDVIYQELEMDMIQEDLIPPPTAQEESEAMDGKLRNLVANENSERSSEAQNYRGMSKAQMNEQVYNELKNMEAEEFAKLNEGRPDYTVPSKGNNSSNPSSDSKNKEYDWYKDKSNNKSYSGRVTASYNVKGRDALDNPVPTYRCKTQGKVIVKVTINELGQVTDAKIDEANSSSDDCLRSESETYARRWKFDYKSDSKKQDGSITFTFSSQ